MVPPELGSRPSGGQYLPGLKRFWQSPLLVRILSIAERGQAYRDL